MKGRMTTLLVFVAAIAFWAGCAAKADDSGKLPITTKSQKARDLFLQGRDLQERLRAQESRTFFQQAVAEDPEFAQAHYFLALTSPTAKEFFDAMKAAQQFVPSASKGEQLLIGAFAAGVNGDSKTQRKMFSELAAAYPNSERAQNNLGGFYFGQQEYDAAIAQYEKAVKIDPSFSQPYNQMGYAYRFTGDFEKAEAVFKKYIEVLPGDPNPHDSYAELLMKMGRFDESIVQYQKALEANSAFFNSHLGIASNFNFKGDHEAARKQARKLYENAANDGQRRAALTAMTISYVYEGKLEAALGELQKRYDLASGIDDAANMAADLGTMANVLLEFSKTAEAQAKFMASLDTILESNQSDQQKDLARQFNHFNVGRVAVAEGKLDDARQHAAVFRDKANALGNRFQIRATHQLFGLIAMAEKDFDTAVAELEQSNQRNPNNIYLLAMAREGRDGAVASKQLYSTAAHFNAVNSMNQAFVARKSGKMMSAK